MHLATHPRLNSALMRFTVTHLMDHVIQDLLELKKTSYRYCICDSDIDSLGLFDVYFSRSTQDPYVKLQSSKSSEELQVAEKALMMLSHEELSYVIMFIRYVKVYNYHSYTISYIFFFNKKNLTISEY